MEQNSPVESMRADLLRLVSLSEEVETLLLNFYDPDLSGEIKRHRVEGGKLKLIELREAIAFSNNIGLTDIESQELLRIIDRSDVMRRQQQGYEEDVGRPR